jgi:hypothetical protein
MDRRDQELLDKQLRGYDPPHGNGRIGLAAVAVFFAGLVLGGALFSPPARQNAPTRTASNEIPASINGAPPVLPR